MFAIWTNMEKKKDCESKNVTDFDTELYHSLSPTVFFARLLWTKTPGLQQARSSLLIKMFSFYLDMWKTCPGYCNLYTFSVLSRSWTNSENSPTRFYQYCEDDIVRTPKFFAYILSAGAMFLSCISAPTLQWSHKLDLFIDNRMSYRCYRCLKLVSGIGDFCMHKDILSDFWHVETSNKGKPDLPTEINGGKHKYR